MADERELRDGHASGDRPGDDRRPPGRAGRGRGGCSRTPPWWAKVFPARALAAMGERARTLEERLHSSRAQGVRPPRAALVGRGETEYAFRHVLVRDVAYAQIPPSGAEKHRRAAEWIESLAPAGGSGRDARAPLPQRARATTGRRTDPGGSSGRPGEALIEAGDRARRSALNAFAAPLLRRRSSSGPRTTLARATLASAWDPRSRGRQPGEERSRGDALAARAGASAAAAEASSCRAPPGRAETAGPLTPGAPSAARARSRAAVVIRGQGARVASAFPLRLRRRRAAIELRRARRSRRGLGARRLRLHGAASTYRIAGCVGRRGRAGRSRGERSRSLVGNSL